VVCKGRLTMEEIIFSLKHYWRFVDSEALELQVLSWEVDGFAQKVLLFHSLVCRTGFCTKSR
jgi:hypothetical protein